MYIGLDVGTSSVKGVLFSQSGQPLDEASQSYPIQGGKNELELDPLQVQDAVLAVLSQIGKRSGGAVRAIGISSLGEAAVLLGRDDRPLANAILPGDRRGTDEAEAFAGRDDLIQRTGLPVSATYTVSKLLWICRHQPDLYEKIHHVMLFGDYIAFCLTGERGIARSLASRTFAYDIELGRFFSPAQEIDEDWFSHPLDADQKVGRLRDQVALETGLPPGIPVFAGGHDQPCAAVGVGAVIPGTASDSIGTSECIAVNLGRSRLSAQQICQTNFACEPFMVAGYYNTMAYTHTAGRLVEWYLRTLLQNREEGAYQQFNDGCQDSPTGILVLPHFSGSGTPYMDPASTGAIIGLDLRSGPGELYQAILESICYEMRINLQLLQKGGIQCNRIVAVGGGAKSNVWLQMKADIYQMPVSVSACFDASALGAAVAAACGCGDYESIVQGAEQMTGCTATFFPRQQQMRQYDAVYDRYQRVYEALKAVR